MRDMDDPNELDGALEPPPDAEHYAPALTFKELLAAEYAKRVNGKNGSGNGEDHTPTALKPVFNGWPRHPLNWPDLEEQQPPERRWATQSWFGFGHVTLMVGQGGIGKTLCAQQWGSALALGPQALGQPFIDQSPAALRVLMWACEDDHDELWRRQIAISQWLKKPLSAFQNLIIEPRHGVENTLVTTEFGKLMFTPLLGELTAQAEDYRADVVILDNAAQLYGGNENDRHSVTVFLNNLVGTLPGRAIMLLAHPSRSQGSEYSGSSAWEAVARTRLYLGRTLPDQPQDEDPIDTVRYLARRKSNYGPRDYRKFDYGNGVLNQDVTEGADGLIGSIRADKARRSVLQGLQALAAKGVRATDGKTSPAYLPRLLMDYKLNDGLTSRELAEAMRVLVMSGAITTGTIGKYENRVPKYGLMISEGGG